MNMISTGAFLPEMDASNKQETTAEKFARVWEKKNAKAARAGGVSLMALSLAACGGSSEEAAAPVVEAPAEPEAPAVTGTTTALATTRDILSGDSFTTAADTITADETTFTALDVIAEGNSGDGDTLTIAVSDGAGAAAPASVTGIENIVYNVSSFSVDAIDVDNIIGGTITLNNTQLGGTTGANIDNVAATTNVTLGSGVTGTATVDVVTGYTGTINTGSATTVTATYVGADQVATVTVNGDLTLHTPVATDLNITATAASDVTFAIATSTAVDTIVGDANTTLVGGVSLADFTGLTISGAAAVSGAGGTADLTDVSSAITVSTGANAALTVADGASVELAAVMAGANNVAIIAEDDADTTAAAESSVTVTLSDDTTDAAGALGSYEVTITHDATGNDDEITTVNMVVTGDVDHAAGHEGDATLILTDNEIATTVNISGAGDIDLATTTDAANDVTLNAAALTGALDYIITDGVGSVTGGSGDDRIEIETTTEADATIAGGAGDDTLVADGAGSDIGGMTISGFEIISGAFTGLASQFSGADYVVAAGSSISINTATDVDLSTIDLSGMTFAADTLVVTVDLTALAASLPANTAFTYTGSGGADTVTGSANDDTITGGAGIDTLTTGAGDDTIDGGAGNDELEGEAGADTYTTGAGSDDILIDTVAHSAAAVTGTDVTFDSVTDFTTTEDEFDVATVADLLAGANATGVTVTALTTGATSLNDTTIADFAELKVAVDALGLTASAAGVAAAATGLQAYTIDLTGNTGALGTGKYLLLNNNDAVMTADDVMIALDADATVVAGDFII